MTKKEPALPPGIDRRPSGALRVRVYDGFGRRRVVGTFRTLAAAEQARANAVAIRRPRSGRTERSDVAWMRTTARRIRLLDQEDRQLLDAILSVLESRPTAQTAQKS